MIPPGDEIHTGKESKWNSLLRYFRLLRLMQGYSTEGNRDDDQNRKGKDGGENGTIGCPSAALLAEAVVFHFVLCNFTVCFDVKIKS